SQRQEQISLNLQQISRMLRKLFQRARLEKPSQVDPRAAEFTLSLLVAMYDRSGTGYVKTRSAAAALIALSGDTLLAKYRGKKCMILYTVLNAAIVEEKFLSWLRSEPAVLLWLPTCYRLSATEMVSHQARCRVCKIFPITGIRYRCLKCLNFDLCQSCFFTNRLCKPHKRSHPVVEHCVQMSAKANAKHFLCTIKNNLFQERCRRKEARRRVTLESMEKRYMKKQFNKWKDKMQFLHNCQEEKSCRIECHNTMPRNPHVLLKRRTQGGLNPAQIRPTSRTHAEWKSLSPPNPANRMQLLQTPEVPTAVDFILSDDSLESVSLQNDKPFMGQHKKAKEKQTYPPKLTENSVSGIMKNTVLIPTAVQISPDEKEVREEVELLMMKLKDALSLQTQTGINSPVILTLSSYLHPVYSVILFLIM
uniref:Dystrotelin n=1 Tax=Malurus cyaneus samueli TaxID=2593467 RepID=A0A8C5TQA8_9PASS